MADTPTNAASTAGFAGGVESRANFFSRATWGWLSGLLALGYRKPLEETDLGVIDPSDESSRLVAQLRVDIGGAAVSLPELERQLFSSIMRLQWAEVAAAGVAKLLGDLLGFVSPLALAGIVRFVALKAGGLNDEMWGVGGAQMELGYWWLIAVFVSVMLQVCLSLAMVLLQSKNATLVMWLRLQGRTHMYPNTHPPDADVVWLSDITVALK